MTTNKGKRPATAVREGERVCVIGAGSSGIASCQVLHARAIRFDCFEVGSEVGGNWRYMNDNAMSSAYRSLHINTSRDLMTFATFPMPADYPDYPDHFAIARYFDAYVDHFGFRDRIRFRTEVTRVAPANRGGYREPNPTRRTPPTAAITISLRRGEVCDRVRVASCFRLSTGTGICCST